MLAEHLLIIRFFFAVFGRGARDWVFGFEECAGFGADLVAGVVDGDAVRVGAGELDVEEGRSIGGSGITR